jgi:quinol monooxygenase YgiN
MSKVSIPAKVATEPSQSCRPFRSASEKRQRSAAITGNFAPEYASNLSRRDFILRIGAAAVAVTWTPASALSSGAAGMYGLIGKIHAAPGKRDELIAILLEGAAGMPGCLSYVVAKDSTDEDAIWVTEVWDAKESHEASLSLPSVQEAIARGRPLIVGFGERFETAPVGGHGWAAGPGR